MYLQIKRKDTFKNNRPQLCVLKILFFKIAALVNIFIAKKLC